MNILKTTGAGTVVVCAKVADGEAPGKDYEQDFTITVNEQPTPGGTRVRLPDYSKLMPYVYIKVK